MRRSRTCVSDGRDPGRCGAPARLVDADDRSAGRRPTNSWRTAVLVQADAIVADLFPPIR
jgi:hypothetical protein